jgi:P4 family phage/plasmid primase-like protien
MGQNHSSAVKPLCTKADRENIEAAIKTLFEPGQVVELRVPKTKQGTISGYFNDHSKLAVELEELSGEVGAVYYTLNPVNPALLARANNRIRAYATELTNDAPDSILRRAWLLVDCDPVRPAGVSSTVEEKRAAMQLVSEVRDYLKSLGWPDPLIADSGNGYHLLYRIDLPNKEESRKLLESVLKALAARFDTSAVKIDQKVFNASRITKAYGTMACKGDSIAERPHRVSRMFAPPEPIEAVSKELLAALAAEAPNPEKKKSSPTAKTRGGWTPELVEITLDKADLNRGEAMDYKGMSKWQHDCLANPDHRKPDAFTILDEDGYAHHHCSHNSCSALVDEDWRRLWEERTGETYPWPNKRRLGAEEAAALLNEEPEPQECPAQGRHTDRLPRIYPLTDMGNAERFECRFGGEFAWTKETGWLAYRNGVWKEDKTGEADRAMQLTIRQITQEADLVEADGETADGLRDAIIGWAKTSESNSKVKAALERASMLKAFAKDYADFEQQPHLFNCANGTVDLNTGEFRQHDPNDLLLKQSPVNYDPHARCPQWEKFLLEVQDGDKEMVDYLQRCDGYSLSAECGEQCMFIPYGTGGTGKGTYLTVKGRVLGTYAATADPEMFIEKRGDSGQPFEMAGLEGVRVLLAVETDDGKRLAEAKVKRMTGNDSRIRACRKHKDHYDFTPVWKVWLATNYRPNVRGTDDAIWDRPKLIPFDVRFRNQPNEVKNLADKLLEESSGILNWLLAGYQEWKSGGLRHPEKVSMLVREWRDNEDFMARFLDECVEEGQHVEPRKLYERFRTWAEDVKEGRGLSEKKFAEEMQRRGHKSTKIRVSDKTIRAYVGIRLKDRFGEYSQKEMMEEVDVL